MDSKKLDRWAELLLDTGKRNNLVNFHDSKTGTAEVLVPSSQDLFELMESLKPVEVFDPGLIEEEPETPDEDGGSEIETEADERKIPTREEFLSKYKSKLNKQNQILTYSRNKKPINAIGHIEKRAASFIEETGVNVAYMAFGFIHWSESTDSKVFYNAPILLMPIQISRESIAEPYTIEYTGDDILVNPTFMYKISAEYGITLPEYTGEAFESYISEVSKMVAPLRWTVTSECKIGIFSFLKINMYRDLKDNAEKILANRNVRTILSEPIDHEVADAFDEQLQKNKNPLIELHNVVDSDSSQMEAVEMAKSGESFVLQGPPGTGKSQTITNIIAEFLYEGKTVLFVSEKLAALEVVYDKLKKANLEDFCLELHSHKANKKKIIDELCRTLKRGKSLVSAKIDNEIALKEKSQKQLDIYAKELHIPREPIEKSLYELYELYYSKVNAPTVDWDVPNIATKNAKYIKDVTALLEQYVAYSDSVGYNYKNNPWYGYINQDMSYQAKTQVSKDIKTSKTIVEALIKKTEQMKSEFNVGCENIFETENWIEFLELAQNSEFITPRTLQYTGFESQCKAISEMQQLSANIIALKGEYEMQYDASIFNIDAEDYYNRLTRLHAKTTSRLFNSDYKSLIKSLRLCARDGRKFSYQEAVDLTASLARFNMLLKQYGELEAENRDYLGAGYKGIHTDWNKCRREIDIISELFDARMNFGGLAALTNQGFEQNKERFAYYANQFRGIVSEGIGSYTNLSKYFDKQVVDFQHGDFSSVIEKIDACDADFDKLDNYCNFRSLLFEIDAIGIKEFIDSAIEANVEVTRYVDAFQKKFYYQWIDAILQSVPALASFTRIQQDFAVKTFAEKDREQFEISKAQIRARLSGKRPDIGLISPGSPVAILMREGEKKRKQKPIRKLLAETKDIVQIIKPCFLMSPLSVSTFLGATDINFDLVIFDEASQIFPQDAICSIYRGKQVIVVGDSKQMPPSNFFNTTVETEDSDEETEDITDFESILDICSTVMKQLRLKWHYRSRYETLIAFSNKNYYDNDLVTFPSSRTDAQGIGVDYYHVDGIYDRKSRTNRKEAEFIVDLIYENIEKHPNRSLGVVAFNVSQQDLIDTLLAERRQKTPEREYFFSKDVEEPFFIKNLETVQGDERDTIIFSVAYARDSQGRFIHNFGPLNRMGGERRLNVAVTRAKKNVQLVASIHYLDIDLSRTSAEGSRLLREYLDYAENGEIGLERSISTSQYESADSDFEMDVCDFLRNNGFTVDTQVGCSGYRIDIGLRRPDSSDYVMAIECDGATYHSSKNARDRDRLRQEVLENMGWNFYRIWSTDWFRNNKVEKERLLEAAKKALSGSGNDEKPIEKDEPKEDVSFESEAPEKPLQFPAYEKVDIDSIASTYLPYNFVGLVKKILETEAPLSEEYLLKRTVHFFEREKVTSYVLDRYNRLMRGCQELGIIRRDGFLYLADQKSFVLRVPGSETRDIKYISPEELAAGMFVILKHNVSLDKQNLYHKVATLCGAKRRGNAINEQFDKALNRLRSIVDIEDETITLKKK